MYHTVEFVSDLILDLETLSGTGLQPVPIRKSSRRRARLKPYVVETAAGLFEVADLFFDDGTSTRLIPFACICFVDGDDAGGSCNAPPEDHDMRAWPENRTSWSDDAIAVHTRLFERMGKMSREPHGFWRTLRLLLRLHAE